jgi:hypothetical protein
MTTRDRLVLMGLVVLGLLAAGWLMEVSPERSKAASLDAQVNTAKTQLATAQSQLAEAKGAQAQYGTAYASIVRLGQAVPADQQVPSLVYELDQASNGKNVEFNSITSSATGSSSSSSSASSATAAASAGFTQMPFTFIFEGTYVDLYHLLNQVQGFTVQTPTGAIQVSGRLLTVQGASLELSTSGGESTVKPGVKNPTAKESEQSKLKGTITATAYVLPSGQGLTSGATPAGPAGATGATPAASGPSASSPSTAPAAVIKVTP